MMGLLLVYFTIIINISTLSLRHDLTSNSHQYWFMKNNPIEQGDDYSWNYCDLKCIYLENYYPDKDFVVVVFSALFHDTFAACYIKNGEEYTLWSKVVSNSYFEKNCGSDYKDWMHTGDYNIDKVYGIGIGTKLNVNTTYTT